MRRQLNVFPLHKLRSGALFGPFALGQIDTCPAAILAIIIGIKKGLTRRGPFSSKIGAVLPMLPNRRFLNQYRLLRD